MVLPWQCPVLPWQCPVLPWQCPVLPWQCPVLHWRSLGGNVHLTDVELLTCQVAIVPPVLHTEVVLDHRPSIPCHPAGLAWGPVCVLHLCVVPVPDPLGGVRAVPPTPGPIVVVRGTEFFWKTPQETWAGLNIAKSKC